MLSFKIKAVIYHHYTKKGEFYIISITQKKIISYLQIKITINCNITQMIYLYIISTN